MQAGEIIKNERLKRNMSQYDLAKELGVTQPYIHQLETGTRNASDKIKITICNLFNLQIQDVFYSKL